MSEAVWHWKSDIQSWETPEHNGVVVRVEMLTERTNAVLSNKADHHYLIVYAYTTTDDAKARFPELAMDERKKLISVERIGEAMRIGNELIERYQEG